MINPQALDELAKTVTFTLLIIWAVVQIGGDLFGLYDCAKQKINGSISAPPR